MRRCSINRCRTFHASNICKNYLVWAERTNISSIFSNSDSTIIQNQFLHCINVFIGCWSARPYLNLLHHNWTCVLLIVDSPNATVSIRNVFKHLIQFLCTKLLIQFLRSTFRIVKKRISHQNAFLSVKTNWQSKIADIVNIYNRHVCQHNNKIKMLQSKVRNSRNLKITVIFLITYMLCVTTSHI